MRALSYIVAEKITFPPKPDIQTVRQTDRQTYRRWTDISVYRVASLLTEQNLDMLINWHNEPWHHGGTMNHTLSPGFKCPTDSPTSFTMPLKKIYFIPICLDLLFSEIFFLLLLNFSYET